MPNSQRFTATEPVERPAGDERDANCIRRGHFFRQCSPSPRLRKLGGHTDLAQPAKSLHCANFPDRNPGPGSSDKAAARAVFLPAKLLSGNVEYLAGGRPAWICCAHVLPATIR